MAPIEEEEWVYVWAENMVGREGDIAVQDGGGILDGRLMT